MKRLIMACALALGCGTTSNVPHPEAGTPTPKEFCKSGPAEEQNCMACGSKPGCGFCTDPKSGAAMCQPGSPSAPQSPDCNVALIASNEDCPLPPDVPDAAGQ
jgi:hypothetical protein